MKKTYPILVDLAGEDEGKAYSVYFPDIPSCFSAVDSLDELYEKAEEAILLHINGLGYAPEPTPLKDLNLENLAKWFELKAKDFSLKKYLPDSVDVDIN